MKYLRNLPNHNAYEVFINGQNYAEIQQEKNDIISYCKTEQHIHYNPYIPSILPTPTPPTFLDILYSDANGNLSFTSEVLPISDGKTPIALCIAPANFFGDNESARWMSLKYMSYDTPEIGTKTHQNMKWGNYDVDISTIANIQSIYINGHDGNYYIPVDYYDSSQQTNILPSVLDANNEWNLSEIGTVNQYAMSDIDGKNKTNKIIVTATSQSTWQTDVSIVNNQNSGYAPAACCCARYHTLGTQAGDWYLGACGEMIMILVQKTDINAKLAAINAIYPNDCINMLENISLWTSTESGGYGVYYVNTTNALVNKYLKNDSYNAIALLQY